MLAVCAITSLPALRKGGANRGVSMHPLVMGAIIRSSPPPHHIGIVGARLLEREADELAAALNSAQ